MWITRLRTWHRARRLTARCPICHRRNIRVPDIGMDPQFLVDTTKRVCSIDCGRLSGNL